MNVRNVAKAKQSAVAKASYVSGEKLFSARDEETKSFRSREVSPDSFILAPSHAPDWVYNRETLWNEAERVEVPVNARVMREVVVALPIELTDEQQKELLMEYVQENFVDAGMVADVNIHKDREQNPHAHILLTVRPFQENGEWATQKTKKEYLLDANGDFIYNEKGNKKSRNVDLTGWSGKAKIVEWRKNLAEKINEHYQKHGIEQSVSHLSYADQGLDKQAIERLTRGEYAVEKQAKEKAAAQGEDYVPVTHYGKMNQVIEAFNLEIESLNSSIEKLESEIIEVRPSSELADFENIRKLVYEKTGSSHDFKRLENIAYSDSVDYITTSETMKSISSWNEKLINQEREIFVIKSVLDNALKRYEKGEDDSSLIKYGFNRESFETMYKDRVSALSNQYDNLQQEIEEFTQAKAFVSHANELQIELIKEEFAFRYPELDVLEELDSEQAISMMNGLLESDDSIKKADILHELKGYLNDEERHILFVKENVINLSQELTRLTESKESLSKNVEFEKARYTNNMNSDLDNSDSNKLNAIFFARHNFFSVKNQLDAVEKEIKNISKAIDDYLVDYTNDKDNKWLSEINIEQKIETLLSLDSSQTPDFIKQKLSNPVVVETQLETIVDSYKNQDDKQILDYQFIESYVVEGLNKLNDSKDRELLSEWELKSVDSIDSKTTLSSTELKMLLRSVESIKLSNQLENNTLFTRKNILDNALKNYENKNFDQLFRYGFNSHTFTDQLGRRTASLEQDYDVFQKNFNVSKEERFTIEKMLKVDARKTMREFVERFPSMSSLQKFDLNKSDALLFMKQSLEKYENENVFVKSTEHFELKKLVDSKSVDEMKERTELNRLLDLKEKIYEVAAKREDEIVRLEPLFKATVKQAKEDDILLPKVFMMRNQYYANVNELNKLNKELKAIDEKFKETIQKRIPDVEVEKLSSVGLDRIVSNIADDKELSAIQNTIESEIKNPSKRDEPSLEEKKKMNEPDEENVNTQQSPEALAGDLLASIIEQAQKKQDSTDHNHKKRTHKKLTIEEKIDRDML